MNCNWYFVLLLLITFALNCAGQNSLAQQSGIQATPNSSTEVRLNHESASPVGWHESSIKVDGLDRWYRVFRPEGFQANNPAVVLLHGGGQSMRKIFARDFNASKHWQTIAEQEGLLLIVPNGTARNGDTKGDRQNWNDLRNKDIGQQNAQDVKFLEVLINSLQHEYKFDSTRIYVTGASNGGMMTFRMLIEKPELFAAGVAFIASLPVDHSSVKRNKSPIPLMMCNGTKDPLIKWEGGSVGLNRGRGATCSVDEAVAWWAKTNRCNSEPISVTKLENKNQQDDCQIIRYVYSPTDGGADFEFLKIEGGGHSLPSIKYSLPDNRMVKRVLGTMCRDAEGAELAWEFMQRFQKTSSQPRQ